MHSKPCASYSTVCVCCEQCHNSCFCAGNMHILLKQFGTVTPTNVNWVINYSPPYRSYSVAAQLGALNLVMEKQISRSVLVWPGEPKSKKALVSCLFLIDRWYPSTSSRCSVRHQLNIILSVYEHSSVKYVCLGLGLLFLRWTE